MCFSLKDSETSRASGAKSAVSSEKGGKESGSGGSIIIKRYSIASKGWHFPIGRKYIHISPESVMDSICISVVV